MPCVKKPVLKTATPRITRSAAQHQLERDNIVATQQLAKHDDDAVWSRIPAPRNTYDRRQLWRQLKSKTTVDTIKNRCTPLGPANRLATAPRKCSSCRATPTPIPNQTPTPVNDLEDANDIEGPADFGGLEDFDFEFALVQEDEVMPDHEEGKGGEEVQDVVKQSAVLYDPQPSSEELIIALEDSSCTLEAGFQYIQSCYKEERYPLCLRSINQIDLANFHGEKFREHITNLVNAEKRYEGHYPLQVHRKIWTASYQKVRAHHDEKHKIMMAAKRIIQIWGEDVYNRVYRPRHGHASYKYYEAVRSIAIACHDFLLATRVFVTCYLECQTNRGRGQKAVKLPQPEDWRKALHLYKETPDMILTEDAFLNNVDTKEVFSSMMPTSLNETPSTPVAGFTSINAGPSTGASGLDPVDNVINSGSINS
ncbi:MAG: hypothetical protein MMC33_006853 [Icmadophila ericetorum]|nr:hypothetical protein [Icmadophila ericetorum]